ncbi:hypothetical protein FGE12_23870 [Aggregicoccus sp. 17bor-14]|uniref:hypothetical protein n=1 Tax=Myxococcaceae TaxID=31 RepID=UPI00129C7C80|nr:MULTISPECIES: hypothetical protein [Myxococcaceae]MBF5045466.1 hypothetical protein [Simulacricoccus sp. 17bor-14]MRI91204.1 hypothetical protein [Aggregicoccus sp. 17bor-14]
MTSETLPQAYRVRIPEELQPALDALPEEARTALLAALFERAMQPAASGATTPHLEPLQVSGLQAELERDPVHARLTLVALRAAFATAAASTPSAPALVVQESAQAAWERAGAL